MTAWVLRNWIFVAVVLGLGIQAILVALSLSGAISGPSLRLGSTLLGLALILWGRWNRRRQN